jgi:hypothetical protein
MIKESANCILRIIVKKKVAGYEDKTKRGSHTSKYRHSTGTREKKKLDEKQPTVSRTT